MRRAASDLAGTGSQQPRRGLLSSARCDAQQDQRTLPLAGIKSSGHGEQLAKQRRLLGRHFDMVGLQ